MNAPLIQTLNQLKQALVYQKITLYQLHSNANFLLKIGYQNQLSKVALLETQITVLQQKLSLIVSSACSILIEYHAQQIDVRQEWIDQLKPFLHRLSIPIELWIFMNGLKRFDKPISKSCRIDPVLIDINKKCLEHYMGSEIIAEYPMVNAIAIFGAIEQIKDTDFNDPNSLNQLVAIIGKNEAFDWKAHESTKWYKGRLN